MNRHTFSFPVFLTSSLLSAMISFASVMCLVDSFGLSCRISYLLAACAGFSLLASAVLFLHHSRLIAVTAAVVYFAVLFGFRQSFFAGLSSAVYAVTEQYALAYANVSVTGIPGADSTGCLILLALPLACFPAWVINREGSVLFVLLACAPVLCLVLMIVDLAPERWLVLLTAALLLLILTNGVRNRNAGQGSLLLCWLLVPVFLLTGFLAYFWPPDAYERSPLAQNLQLQAETLLNHPGELPFFSSDTAPSETVALDTVGPRSRSRSTVMEYRSDTSLSYLRGVFYTTYDENVWMLEEEPPAETPLFPSDLPVHTAEIRTRRKEPYLYTPYYTLSEQLPYQTNQDGLRQYSVQYRETNLYSTISYLSPYVDYVNQTYLQLPETLRPILEEILLAEGLLQGSAEEIAQFVRSGAVYDLNTPAVPEGEDFVLYFLQESHRGYCVHFASAATLLLRAAGIPARYVTGFSVSGEPDQWNTVREDQAHAWVEYYAGSWQVLDPTPSAPSTEAVSPSEEEVLPPYAPQQPERAESVPTPSEPTATPISTSRQIHWWLPPLGAIVLLTVLLLRRFSVLHHRKKQLYCASPNEAALLLWQQMAALSRHCGKAPSEALICLAEKAKFSQHTLTEQELDLLSQAVREHQSTLRSRSPLPKRIWHRLGPVLY